MPRRCPAGTNCRAQGERRQAGEAEAGDAHRIVHASGHQGGEPQRLQEGEKAHGEQERERDDDALHGAGEHEAGHAPEEHGDGEVDACADAGFFQVLSHS